MAVSHKGYIYGTFLLACLSVAFLSIGIATQNWVSGTARIVNSTSRDSVDFGLFRGSHVISLVGSTQFSVYLSCLLGNNICAYSCRENADLRKSELENYYKGNMLQPSCQSEFVEINSTVKAEDITWFNGGVYISTLTFLGLGLFFAVLAALFGIYNGSKSPIEPIWGVFGLYIWNGASAFCTLVAIILWGVHYETNMTENYTYTMMFLGDYTELVSTVGYSYWLTFASIICHLAAEGLLIMRFHIIRSEPPPATISIEKTDDTLFLF